MPLTCQQMQQLETEAFARGVSAEDLMEKAGVGIANVIDQFFAVPGLAVMYLGKGNNAGDALVVGRELLKRGWRVAARLSCEPEEMKPLPLMHWRSLDGAAVRWSNSDAAAETKGKVILLDGLLGIGTQGALRGELKALAAEMNALRRSRHAVTIAMDLPSGLDGDTGVPCEEAVIADITVTVAHVKTGLLTDTATKHVGRLAIVPLAELACESSPGVDIITSASLLSKLPRRCFEMHKGQSGRVAIVAGSRGYLGAALLASLGAMRGGAGLITLMVKDDVYPLMATRVPPEIMVKPVASYREALTGYDVIVIGPGLGFAHEEEVMQIIREATQPVVVDADAITMLAKHGTRALAGPRLLTPHPGEMTRLLASQPELVALDRVSLAARYAEAHPNVTLLFKGSRTVIATHGEPLRANTTGTPAMACGGMGDVLSGLCAALMAQGVSLHDSACMGSWLLGRAAERAVYGGDCSEESLSATDVAAHLGGAFDDVRALAF